MIMRYIERDCILYSRLLLDVGLFKSVITDQACCVSTIKRKVIYLSSVLDNNFGVKILNLVMMYFESLDSILYPRHVFERGLKP